jgi:hypothetical protein
MLQRKSSPLLLPISCLEINFSTVGGRLVYGDGRGRRCRRKWGKEGSIAWRVRRRRRKSRR